MFTEERINEFLREAQAGLAAAVPKGSCELRGKVVAQCHRRYGAYNGKEFCGRAMLA